MLPDQFLPVDQTRGLKKDGLDSKRRQHLDPEGVVVVEAIIKGHDDSPFSVTRELTRPYIVKRQETSAVALQVCEIGSQFVGVDRRHTTAGQKPIGVFVRRND